jgi:hypothetical protein
VIIFNFVIHKIVDIQERFRAMKKYIEITNDLERAKKFFENEMAYKIGPVGLKELIEKKYKQL